MFSKARKEDIFVLARPTHTLVNANEWSSGRSNSLFRTKIAVAMSM